jgi:hypothetical protein
MANNLPTLAPANMTEAIEFSKMLAQSEMVPKNYHRKPQDILVAMQWGYEVGLQPLQALQNIAVINGRPSIYGDAALALVKNHPSCAGVSERVEGDGDNRTAYCTVKRRYGDEVEETTRTFSVVDAKRARLWGKQGPWSQYPDRMLAMRARGFAVRDGFPDALKGIITQEEALDMPKEPVNVTPPDNPLDAIAAPTAPEPEIVVEDTVETVEPVVEPPEAEETLVEYQMVSAAGKTMGDPATCLDDFANGFLRAMTTYVQATKTAGGKELTPRERMTMLRQLRENNQGTLDQMSEADMQIITEAYKKNLAALGASQ